MTLHAAAGLLRWLLRRLEGGEVAPGVASAAANAVRALAALEQVTKLEDRIAGLEQAAGLSDRGWRDRFRAAVAGTGAATRGRFDERMLLVAATELGIATDELRADVKQLAVEARGYPSLTAHVAAVAASLNMSISDLEEEARRLEAATRSF